MQSWKTSCLTSMSKWLYKCRIFQIDQRNCNVQYSTANLPDIKVNLFITIALHSVQFLNFLPYQEQIGNTEQEHSQGEKLKNNFIFYSVFEQEDPCCGLWKPLAFLFLYATLTFPSHFSHFYPSWEEKLQLFLQNDCNLCIIPDKLLAAGGKRSVVK